MCMVMCVRLKGVLESVPCLSCDLSCFGVPYAEEQAVPCGALCCLMCICVLLVCVTRLDRSRGVAKRERLGSCAL